VPAAAPLLRANILPEKMRGEPRRKSQPDPTRQAIFVKGSMPSRQNPSYARVLPRQLAGDEDILDKKFRARRPTCLFET
jgi:hypothetical protein